MSDDEREPYLATYHALAEASEQWVYLNQAEDDLQGRLAAAAWFALAGTASKVVDIDIALDDDLDPSRVEVVIVASDRLVVINHEPEQPLRTRVFGRSAIRFVELLKLPNVMSDRPALRRGPIVMRFVLDTGDTFEIGNHAATHKLREQILAALPKILGRLS